jgi:Mg-chelatase subunit ChlD
MWESRISLCTIVAIGLAASFPFPARACASFSLKKNLDLPAEAAGDSGDDESLPEIIVFYGQQYEGDGVFFCCDKSGSMAGAKWKRLQGEVTRNLRSFSPRVQFGIVLFDSKTVAFPSSGRPAEASEAMKAQAIEMVMATGTGQLTCAKPALAMALNYANSSTSKRKIIIYLSDGWNTCACMESGKYSTEILSEVAQRNTQHVRINALCIGPAGKYAVNEDFMRALASQNSGTYVRLVQ